MTNFAQLYSPNLSIRINIGTYSLKCIWTFDVGLSKVPMVNSKYFARNSSSKAFGPSTPSRCSHSSYCETRPDVGKLNLVHAVRKSSELMSLPKKMEGPEHGKPSTFVTDAYVMGNSLPCTNRACRSTSTCRANSLHRPRCNFVTFKSSRDSNPSESNSLRNSL